MANKRKPNEEAPDVRQHAEADAGRKNDQEPPTDTTDDSGTGRTDEERAEDLRRWDAAAAYYQNNRRLFGELDAELAPHGERGEEVAEAWVMNRLRGRIADDGSDFSLNNNCLASVVRQAIVRNPKLARCFKLRSAGVDWLCPEWLQRRIGAGGAHADAD